MFISFFKKYILGVALLNETFTLSLTLLSETKATSEVKHLLGCNMKYISFKIVEFGGTSPARQNGCGLFMVQLY